LVPVHGVAGKRGWTPSEAAPALQAMVVLDLTPSEELYRPTPSWHGSLLDL
jgi:hypothetical protein